MIEKNKKRVLDNQKRIERALDREAAEKIRQIGFLPRAIEGLTTVDNSHIEGIKVVSKKKDKRSKEDRRSEEDKRDKEHRR